MKSIEGDRGKGFTQADADIAILDLDEVDCLVCDSSEGVARTWAERVKQALN